MKLKLKNFPLVMHGFKEIQLDQYIQGMELNAKAEIGEDWVAAFECAEKLLNRLKFKKLGKFMPELLTMDYYDDLQSDNSVIYLIYMPVNDTDKLLMRKAGCTELEIFAINMLFYQFFDGELREVFQTVKAGSPYAKLRARAIKGAH